MKNEKQGALDLQCIPYGGDDRTCLEALIARPTTTEQKEEI